MTIVFISCAKLEVAYPIQTQDMPPVNVAEVFSFLIFVFHFLVVDEELHSSRLAIRYEPVVELYC